MLGTAPPPRNTAHGVCLSSRLGWSWANGQACVRQTVPRAALQISPLKRLRKEVPMNSLLSRLSPSITNMIRMDHAHVLTTFHQYEADSSPRVKKGLVDNVCVALEIHAQLEEE